MLRESRWMLFTLVVAVALVGADAAAQPRSISNGRVETIASTRGLATTARDLASRTGEAFWFGYAVPILEGTRGSCCYWSDEAGRGDTCCVGCRLEPAPGGGPPVTIGGTGNTVRLEGASMMLVLARVEGGAIAKIRTFAEDCPLDAGGRTVYWLTGVTSTESLAWLASWLDGDPKIAQNATSAIAMHRDPEAAVRLIGLARAHANGRVRSEALFWLAQRAGERAAPTITDAIANDPETEVKKRAVFALTQLPKDEGVPLLIRVARTNRNPEVRKQAMFWLGQSKDQRALAFFEEILKVK
jgi:hypothetical protein